MSPDLHHLSGAYAVDALDEGERAAFEQHLAGCPDCRAEVAELAAAAHSLTSVVEAAPPPELRAAVLSRISTVRPLPPLGGDDGVPSAGGAPAADRGVPASAEGGAEGVTYAGLDEDAVPPRAEAEGHEPHEVPGRSARVVPLRRRASTWFAAAAAAVLLAVGGLVWSPWSDPVDTSPLAQVQTADDAMRVSSTKGDVTAEVTYSRRLGRAAFTVDGLPPAPEGQTYQLWYVGTDEVPRSAGLLTPAADGTGRLLLQGDANSAAAVGMTLEPAGGSERPTTDPMVVLALA